MFFFRALVLLAISARPGMLSWSPNPIGPIKNMAAPARQTHACDCHAADNGSYIVASGSCREHRAGIDHSLDLSALKASYRTARGRQLNAIQLISCYTHFLPMSSSTRPLILSASCKTFDPWRLAIHALSRLETLAGKPSRNPRPITPDAPQRPNHLSA